jgi:hypothetical protein
LRDQSRRGTMAKQSKEKGIASARKRLVRAVKPLIRNEDVISNIREAKLWAKKERTKSIWDWLLSSFATLGGARGYDNLMADKVAYQNLSYRALATLSRPSRRAQVRRALKRARIRFPNKKTRFVLACFDRIQQDLKGLRQAKNKLFAARGKQAKMDFLEGFAGIGPQYARSIMMDIYDPAFRKSVKIDTRISGISKELALPFGTREHKEHEEFYLSATRDLRITGWELDRILFNFTEDVKGNLAMHD